MNVLLKLTVLSVLGVLGRASEPYCTRNETTVTRTPVTKTRMVIKKPTGAFKWFKKTKYQTEVYEDYEEQRHFKLVHGCCDGYRMTEQRLCEPVCEQSCPKNAFCVEPNVCECSSSYVTAVSSIDGSHYCEPICKGACPINARCVEPDICECEPGYHKLYDEFKCVPRCSSGCPFGGQCISPEQCVCAEGYSADLGTCLPICTAGDGCQHGKCVEPERCVCLAGYYMNQLNQLCEERTCNDEEGDCDYTEEPPSTESDEVQDFENDRTHAVDNELFDEDERIFVSAPDTDLMESSTDVACPPHFFYYNNVCRPKQFASNEFDCRFKPCVEHAFCQANGTCACSEGFIWLKHKSAETSTEESVTDESIEASVAECLTPAQIQQLSGTVRKADDDDEGPMDWLSLGVITLGVLCMLGALCFLVFKLLRQRKGNLDVEAKNDLTCSYDNRNYSNSPHVY